jgi:hypothetical protein
MPTVTVASSPQRRPVRLSLSVGGGGYPYQSIPSARQRWVDSRVRRYVRLAAGWWRCVLGGEGYAPERHMRDAPAVLASGVMGRAFWAIRVTRGCARSADLARQEVVADAALLTIASALDRHIGAMPYVDSPRVRGQSSASAADATTVVLLHRGRGRSRVARRRRVDGAPS